MKGVTGVWRALKAGRLGEVTIEPMCLAPGSGCGADLWETLVHEGDEKPQQ